MKARLLIVAVLGLAGSCGDVRNSEFGTPNASTQADASGFAPICACTIGFCCGNLCCSNTDTCCMSSTGVPFCATGAVTTCDLMRP